MQTADLFKEAFPALPPPKEAAPTKRRLLTVQVLLRGICLLVAVSVLSLCAYQKLDAVFEDGIVTHVQKALFLPSNSRAIGDKVITVAFGSLKSTTISNESTEIAMPKIFYIPKEELVRRIEDEKTQADIKIADLYSYDLSAVPKGYYPIIPTNSAASDFLALKNDTGYMPNMEEISKKAEEIPPADISGEPLVLIVHTHGTESFSNDTPYYNDSFNYPRSNNVSENIVAVGKVLYDELNKKGIPTLHCETMHDKESYISAYDRSAESIRYYLEKYPTIEYVFDVHRDSLIRSDLTKLRPVTLRGNTPCAQIMMIIGTDEKGAGEYAWEENLVLATAIQKKLTDNTAAIARKLYLRGASYNQQYAKHGLLLEIGSCGNTLKEAKEAARAFADAFEKVIKK